MSVGEAWARGKKRHTQAKGHARTIPLLPLPTPQPMLRSST